MFQISSSNKLAYYHETSNGQHVAFSSMYAGNMSLTVRSQRETTQNVTRNRKNFEHLLGIAPGTTNFVSQTHSTTVLTASAANWEESGTIGEGDAIMSPRGHSALGILTADCLPIAFTTDYGASAIAHAGRLGLLNGILQNTVHELTRVGNGKIQAFIGPGICGKCYEVPVSMRDEAAVKHPEIAAKTSWNTASLDLPKTARIVLERLDVEVTDTGLCTYESEMLYSHRRQPGEGRIAGFVWQPLESS